MIHPSVLRKFKIYLTVFSALIIITALLGMALGYSSVPFARLPSVIAGEGTFKENFVFFQVRLPRIIITVLAGMALALSGAILQSLSRNDLADPGIIGINAGAGAAVAVFFLFAPLEPGSFIYLLPVVAFLGALATAVAIYLFSFDRRAGFQPIRLILVGVGFSMALSGLMIILISSAEREKVNFISQWLAGDIWGADWPFILALLPWLLLLIPFTFYKANRMNILNLSEPVSIELGLPLGRERFSMLMAAVALAASAVSVTGGISFIGLMAPHLAKTLIGPRTQLYMPLTLLLGGWLLLAADTIGRNVLEPDGLPAGVMTALIGAPYFIYLLTKK
ncbi:iron ABC transporter permease [Salimicrobium jeotgali]|uniref:Iron ABC transporter permease n=2 Tax=Salimicrobium TaxID=351195 RepID=K2FKS5_9BACI|nr:MULTISPECIES: iron ABC transporter permease [Salimicrobium]AKG04927.1 iron ABC transporter permease [Salimicrobium jeotgali]EKE31601.1 iron compound ABC transporter permease [Salimicrobium jeotgali]MBM7696422.1 iron complex transport system permease protein [Salimicrobium jeotgali]PBB06166.1 iron ABC transporter permease [Salimicrobium humidisoli]